MLRAILAIVAGFVVWVVVVTLLNFGLRFGIPGYTEAEPTMAFTLPMLIARLLESAVATIAGGLIVRLIAPASRIAPIILGLLLLALFVPLHISIWPRFPVWYHLTFLLSLPLLTLAGAALTRPRPPIALP